MSNPEQPRLTIPIKGFHVLEALFIARFNPDDFRRSEMAWLQLNNSFLRGHLGDIYRIVISQRGIERGDALLQGYTLGHFAVRSCLGHEHEAYELARQNYHRIITVDALCRKGNPVESELAWDSEDVLQRIFNDEGLVAALLEVRDDTARDAAAYAIGCFGLTELPAPFIPAEQHRQ